MSNAMAVNIMPIRSSVKALRAQVIFNSGGQPAQTGKQFDIMTRYREEQRVQEEQRQFYYHHPERQLQKDQSNPNPNKDDRSNTPNFYRVGDDSKYIIRPMPSKK
jgi:hypothetical protein